MASTVWIQIKIHMVRTAQVLWSLHHHSRNLVKAPQRTVKQHKPTLLIYPLSPKSERPYAVCLSCAVHFVFVAQIFTAVC